jgi:hypothetical protein
MIMFLKKIKEPVLIHNNNSHKSMNNWNNLTIGFFVNSFMKIVKEQVQQFFIKLEIPCPFFHEFFCWRFVLYRKTR